MDTYENLEALGSIKIADDVVAGIAALAATEVEGIYATGGVISNEIMSKVGMKNAASGVKVDINNGKVKIDMNVTMDYGYNIPATSQKVQTKIKQTIENMTGLEVINVNLRIASISLKKDETK